MILNPLAPPFFEPKGGPYTDRIKAHVRSQARIAKQQARLKNPQIIVDEYVDAAKSNATVGRLESERRTINASGRRAYHGRKARASNT